LGVSSGSDAYNYSPQVNLQATRHWRKQGWSVNVFGKYQGQQQSYLYTADDSLVRGHIADYVMLDASISKQVWSQRLTVQLGCKNIANITNLEASLGNGGAHSGSGAARVPLATGRTYFLRLALDLKGKPKETRP
jgi:outer membrane receptor for ferrienterochelin and colicins